MVYHTISISMEEVRERKVEIAVVDVTVAVIYLNHLNSSPVHCKMA